MLKSAAQAGAASRNASTTSGRFGSVRFRFVRAWFVARRATITFGRRASRPQQPQLRFIKAFAEASCAARARFSRGPNESQPYLATVARRDEDRVR